MEYLESSSAEAFNPKFEILARLNPDAFPQLDRETLARAVLIEKKLAQVTITHCTFLHAQLLGSTFEGCRFFDSSFTNSEINGTDFFDCSFKRVSFKTSTLRNSRFERCTFEDCEFQAESGEPIHPDDRVSFTDAILINTAFTPLLPKVTRDEIFKRAWQPAAHTPAAAAETKTPPPSATPVALAAAPSGPATPSAPVPAPVAPGGGRFGSLEL